MSKGLNGPHIPIAVAIYLPEQYPRLVATAEDARELEATWQEWHQVMQETRQHMAALGMSLVEVIVDLDALEQYCQEQGLPNTSSTRAQFAAALLAESHHQRGPFHQRSSLKRRSKKQKRNSG